MKKILFLVFIPFLGFSQSKVNFDFNIHVGGSVLIHNANYRVTSLGALYETVSQSFHPPSSYKWEQFEEDYSVKSTVSTFRYGLSTQVSYKGLPFFIRGEAMSSTSGYQKLCFSGTVGLQYEKTDPIRPFFWKGSLGYKRVIKDYGWGSETMVNSIGNDKARAYIATYFDPKQSLGSQTGNLLSAKATVGTFTDDLHKTSAAFELYGDLDLTNETVHQARMSNVGLNLTFTF